MNPSSLPSYKEWLKEHPLPEGESLKTFQVTALEKIIDESFRKKDSTGCACTAPTGHGKTLIIGEILRYSLDVVPAVKDHPATVKVMVLAPKPTLVQMSRSFKKFQKLDTFRPSRDVVLLPYSGLSSTLGKLFLSERLDWVGAEPKLVFEWHRDTTPALIIYDEAHSLMRTSSRRTKIALAYSRLNEENRLRHYPERYYSIGLSATLASRVSELEHLAVSSSHPYKSISFGVPEPLTPKTFSFWASHICLDSAPEEHNLAAFKRALKDLEDKIIKVPHQPTGAVWDISPQEFVSPESKERYALAMDIYYEKLAKLGKEPKGFEIFAIIREYSKSAEKERSLILGNLIHSSWEKGNAPCAAFLFKENLLQTYDILTKKYSIPKEQIAIVWGGLTESNLEGLKRYSEDKEDLVEVDAEFDSLTEDEEQSLTSQSPSDRQEMIDDFQSGKRTIFLFTYAAGGTGIDLPRNKPELRVRELFLGCIYHDKLFVQGNRVARITSIGETPIHLVLLNNTIETKRVMPKLIKKITCLHRTMGAGCSFASSLIPDDLEIADALEKKENLIGEGKVIELEVVEEGGETLLLPAPSSIENNEKEKPYDNTESKFGSSNNESKGNNNYLPASNSGGIETLPLPSPRAESTNPSTPILNGVSNVVSCRNSSPSGASRLYEETSRGLSRDSSELLEDACGTQRQGLLFDPIQGVEELEILYPSPKVEEYQSEGELCF